MEKYFKNFEFEVKKLNENNIFEVFEICKNNKKYYKKYLCDKATLEEVSTIFTALPPNTETSQKYVLGFYSENKLTAFADIITGYPTKTSGMIGLFMVEPNLQRQGIGRKIVQKIFEVLKTLNLENCEIGVIDNNIEGINFWKKMGFSEYATKKQDNLTLIKMQKKL